MIANRSCPPLSGKYRRYSSTQIRAVLASTLSHERVAAEQDVALATVKSWREGRLPQWFADEERARSKALATARASRFYNPADARAGR